MLGFKEASAVSRFSRLSDKMSDSDQLLGSQTEDSQSESDTYWKAWVQLIQPLHVQFQPDPVPFFGIHECIDFFKYPAHEFVAVALYNPYLNYEIDWDNEMRRYISIKWKAIACDVRCNHYNAADLIRLDFSALGSERPILDKQLDVHVSLGSFQFSRGKFKKLMQPLESSLQDARPIFCVCSKNMSRAQKRVYYLDIDSHNEESVRFFRECSNYLASVAVGNPDARQQHHISFYPARP